MALLFSGAEPFFAILKEGIMGNIHVKLYEIWFRRSCCLKKKFKEKV